MLPLVCSPSLMPATAASFFKENIMIRKTMLAVALGTLFAAPLYNAYAEGDEQKEETKAELIVAEGDEQKDEKKTELIS
jgi:hypothetical protein